MRQLRHTILNQDVQTLLDQQRCIEDDKTEAQWQNIVSGTLLEKLTNSNLGEDRVSTCLVSHDTSRGLVTHQRICLILVGL